MDRGGQVSFLGSQVDIYPRIENLITGLVLELNLFERLGRIVEYS